MSNPIAIETHPISGALKPGSAKIRPTREDAEQDIDQFYALLSVLRERRELPLKKIAYITGDETGNPEASVSKKITSRTLPKEARDFILRYIFDEANLLSGASRKQLSAIQDAFYFAFLNYLAVKETSQDTSRARVLGTYRLWRPSVETDGQYVYGKIEFTEEPDTRALAACMVQIRRPGPGDPGEKEVFTGYLFRVSHMHLLVLRDVLAKSIRVTILTGSKPSEFGTDLNPKSPFKGTVKHAGWMDGFVLGVDGGRGFFSPLYLSLVDDVDELAGLDQELDIIGADDPRMPPRVLNKLQRNGPLRRL
jgi:hypothetical protein